MLTKKQIKALIVIRSIACTKSCNSHHINHVMGQVRALASVLKGVEPPQFNTLMEAFDFCDISYGLNPNGTVGFPSKWLERHGFIVDEKHADGFRYKDPSFGSW
jgi:hypothetical protein